MSDRIAFKIPPAQTHCAPGRTPPGTASRALVFARRLPAFIFAAALGLALFLAPAAHAANIVIWQPGDPDASGAQSGDWDTSTANWVVPSGIAGARFSNSNAVIFGIDAEGNATGATGHITISGRSVEIGAQAYNFGSGTGVVTGAGMNPGVLIASGAWHFTGGEITGGGFSIIGSSTISFEALPVEYIATSADYGRRYFRNQRFEIADNVDFTFYMPENNIASFTGTGVAEVDGGALRSGANSNVVLNTSFAGFFFDSNTTSGNGGAISAGGNFSAEVSTVPHTVSNWDAGNWLNAMFVNNTATGQGGAIYAVGDVTLAPPSSEDGYPLVMTPYFVDNKSYAEGGAIYAGGNVIVSGSTMDYGECVIKGNSADGAGGAIYAGGDVTIGGSGAYMSIASNTASGGSGGVVYAHGAVTIGGPGTDISFESNTSAGSGGAIYAGGDITLSGVSTFKDSRAAAEGGTFYTDGNLIVSGSGSVVSVLATYASGTLSHASSIARVGGTMMLGEHTTFMTEGGGIEAQEFDFTNATIGFTQTSGASSGTLTLTTVDDTRAPVAASGTDSKIHFDNVTIAASVGALATSPGSDITISGTLTVSASGVYLAGRNTIISPDLAGSGAFLKTGPATVELTGNNTYTGNTTINAGTLIGNIPDNGDLIIYAGGIYRSGSGADRNISNLTGSGLIDMMDNTLNISRGDFGSGTMQNASTVNKISTDTFVIGTGIVGDLNINDGILNIGGNQLLTVTGTIALASGAAFGVNLTDLNALQTNAFVSTGGTINIAGYGLITDYATSGTHILIVSETPIDHGTYTLNVRGRPIGIFAGDDSEFLSFSQDTTSDASDTSIIIATSLVWNNTDPASAHGTFNVNSGTFTLIAALANNTDSATHFGGWDGESLTKKGAGTLVLTGASTYTGTTRVMEGILNNTGSLETSEITIDADGTFVNSGVLKPDSRMVNDGMFHFIGASVSAPPTDDEDTPGIGAEDQKSTLPGEIVNSGTVLIDLREDEYRWSGTLSGTSGVFIKTNEYSLVFQGTITYTGTLQIDQGIVQVTKPDMLEDVSEIHLTSSEATLNLGGYDQSLKSVVNNGVIWIGPNLAAGATIDQFAKITIRDYRAETYDDPNDEFKTSNGVIAIRSNYNASLADTITITGTASGTHVISIYNCDNVTPDKSLPYIPIIDGDAVKATNPDILFTGAKDVGMGRLIVVRGDESWLSPDPDIWYLASGDRVSNAGDAILATASVAGLEWHYLLDSVRQRMGDLRRESLMAPPATRPSPLAYTNITSKGGNAWLRGNAYRLNASETITTDSFKQDVASYTLGYDRTYRWDDNQYLLGFYALTSRVGRKFSHRGDGRTDGLGAGFYFSYLKDNGWYGDTTLLITRNRNSFTAHPIDHPEDSIRGDYNHIAWGISQEVGKVFRIKKTDWWYEPSAQVGYALIKGRRYLTSTDMEVVMDNATTRQFRAAIRAGYDIPGGPWSPVKPHVRLAIASASTSGGRIRAGGADYPLYYKADRDGTRVEAGAGLSYVIDEKSQVYLDYEYARASAYKRPWAVSIGYRSTW